MQSNKNERQRLAAMFDQSNDFGLLDIQLSAFYPRFFKRSYDALINPLLL